MRYLSIGEVLELHRQLIQYSRGVSQIRDIGALSSAIAQPRMTYANNELYPSLEEKAAALCFSLVCNHPFVDGNKRVGHAAMETFLFLNGYEIAATVDAAEQIILGVASGQISRNELLLWLKQHLIPRSPS